MKCCTLGESTFSLQGNKEPSSPELRGFCERKLLLMLEAAPAWILHGQKEKGCESLQRGGAAREAADN